MTSLESTAEITDVNTAQPAANAKQQRSFDGIICIGGEDWWYHNRGHYDMQMMRELSATVPVLYVNSIGMRFPKVREGRMFITRIRRKLRSIRRGLVHVRPGFSVVSPFTIPGKKGRAINRWILPRQIKRCARRCGMKKPLLWVACPPGANLVDQLDPVGIVYQRTDRFEEFPGVDPQQIGGYDRSLKQQADLTLFCSSLLLDEERDQCRNPAFFDHGVDYDRFAQAGDQRNEPHDVANLPKPRVGFVGGIDIHTFDPPMFAEVAKQLDDVQFVLVGACSLEDGWCPHKNVAMLGRKPYDEVADYMAACDVLIMPWNEGEWIKACNPVKLKEYLAVGRPVVSTTFEELKRYDNLVTVAQGADDFAMAIREALDSEPNKEAQRERVQQETWAAKADGVLHALQENGIRPS